MPSRMIACSLGLLAFAAAIVAGIVVGNPAITTLWRALLAMAGCYMVGGALGKVAECTLSEHIEQHKRAHPLEPADQAPKDAAEAQASASEAQETPDGASSASANRRATEQQREVTPTDGAPGRAAATEQAAA